jgi:hypothetical protein
MALGFGLWAVYWSQRRFRLAGLATASACRMQVEETSNFWVKCGLHYPSRKPS